MIKRIALISFSLMCLAITALVAFHLGNQSARATVTVPNSGIVAMYQESTSVGFLMLDENGDIWKVTVIGGQLQCFSGLDDPPSSLPVPVDHIKFWEWKKLVTHDNHAWVYITDPATGDKNWVDCGQWPGGPIPTTPSSIGNVKANYKQEDSDD